MRHSLAYGDVGVEGVDGVEGVPPEPVGEATIAISPFGVTMVWR
jgi:hypothetical protein